MNYWQVAAGDKERDYSDVFLKYGVMIVGPGDPGNYFDNKDHYDTYDRRGHIKRFVEQVQEDDVVVLKKPCKSKWEILAVGTEIGKYEWLQVFSDVEGWDLQHCRSVKWVTPKQKKIVPGLVRGTFKGIDNEVARQAAIDVLDSGIKKKAEKIPKPVKIISDEDLIDILINNGFRPKDAEDFTETIHRIRRLIKWYVQYGKHVKEHETRTFMIVPLLLTLGWSEQKLKIEWNNIDIAFFKEPYNGDSKDCVMILESKRLWGGLEPGERQAKTYSRRFPKCDRLIVSDGVCYKLFKRQEEDWKYSAYLNVLKPTLKHPYESNVGGAPDVFLSLLGK